MAVCFLTPHIALREFIEHYAYCEIGSKDRWSATDMASPGRTALAIALRRDRIILKRNGNEAKNFTPLTFTGQITRAIHFDFYDRLKLFFVIFRPCGVFPLLGIYQEECKNSCLNFMDLMGSSVQAFEKEVISQDQATEAKKIADSFFLQRISESSKKQERIKYQSQRLADAVETMSSLHSLRLPIKDICRQTGYSQRTLERRMKKIVGLTPKEFQRIIRFNRALRYIDKVSSEFSWSQIADQFGYYDQAHFIKEFKHFYGETPAGYLPKDSRFLSDFTVK